MSEFYMIKKINKKNEKVWIGIEIGILVEFEDEGVIELEERNWILR